MFLKDQSWVLFFLIYAWAIFFYAISNLPFDTTLYACEPSMDLVLSKLEKDTYTVFTWFQNNYLKVNSGKLHLLTTSDNVKHINIGGNELSSSN